MSYMQHHFNVEIAQKFDISVAIFLDQIVFWIKKNEANNKHFHKDRYWTYNSSKALGIIFPYWSEDQIDRIIKKCISFGLLLTDNFNKSPYDRTRWCALTDDAHKLFGLELPRNRGIGDEETENSNREIAEPIPSTNTSTNTDKIKSSCAKEHAQAQNSVTRFDDFWEIYPKKKNKKRSEKIWAKNKLDKKADVIIKAVVHQIQYELQWQDKKYIPDPDTYLRNERWNDEVVVANINSRPAKKDSSAFYNVFYGSQPAGRIIDAE